MSDKQDEQKPAKAEETPAHPSDERSIDLSEGRRGIDVRPTSDPAAVSLPPMGGLAPMEAAPADSQGGVEGQPSGQGSAGGGSDGEE